MDNFDLGVLILFNPYIVLLYIALCSHFDSFATHTETNTFRINYIPYLLFAVTAFALYSAIGIFVKQLGVEGYFNSIFLRERSLILIFLASIPTILILLMGCTRGIKRSLMGFLLVSLLLVALVAFSADRLSFGILSGILGVEEYGFPLWAGVIMHLFNPFLIMLLLVVQEPKDLSMHDILNSIPTIAMITGVLVAIHWFAGLVFSFDFSLTRYFGHSEVAGFFIPFFLGVCCYIGLFLRITFSEPIPNFAAKTEKITLVTAITGIVFQVINYLHFIGLFQ